MRHTFYTFFPVEKLRCILILRNYPPVCELSGVACKEPNVNIFGGSHQTTLSLPNFNSELVRKFQCSHCLTFLLFKCVQFSIVFNCFTLIKNWISLKFVGIIFEVILYLFIQRGWNVGSVLETVDNTEDCGTSEAVSSSFSPQRHGFKPRVVYVVFAVDKVALARFLKNVN